MSNQIIAEASIDVNEAPRQAENAQKAADNAASGVANLNDPNLMSVIEKQYNISQFAGLTSQYNVIVQNAKDEGIDTTAVTTAYNNLNQFMASVLADPDHASDVDRVAYKKYQDAYNQELANIQNALQNNANSKFTSATSATSQAASTANAAKSAADSAYDYASSETAIQSQATNKAQSTANNAFSQAQAVGSQADSAIAVQSSATATAQSAADNAFSQATTAIDDGKVTSQAVTDLKDGSTLTIAQLGNGLADKVSSSEYASYKTQTASQVAQMVTSGAFSAYSQATAELISAKVATSDFSAYQAITAKSIDSKVDNGDFNTYKTQTAGEISSKVSNIDFNNLTISNRNLALGTATAFKMTGNGSVNNASPMYLTSGTIAKGTTITVSFDIASTNATGVYTIQFVGGTYQAIGNNTLTAGTQHQSYTIVTDTDHSDGVQLRLDNSTSTVTVSNFIISESSKEASWTPAPEDLATQSQITQLGGEIEQKVDSGDFSTYKTQTANLIAEKVANRDFSTYQKQTADLISAKVATSDFTSYKGQTAKDISSKVETSDFNTYKSQTADAITSKVATKDFNSYKTQTANDINLKVSAKGLIDEINLQAGNTLISSSGQLTLSGKTIYFDTANPVIIPSANIDSLLVNKQLTAADISANTFSTNNGTFIVDKDGNITAKNMTLINGTLTSPTINGSTINTPTLSLGLNGTLTTDFDISQPTGFYAPKKGTGTLAIKTGIINTNSQNMSRYSSTVAYWYGFDDNGNMVKNGTNPTVDDYAPGYEKHDIMKSTGDVLNRSYLDAMGLMFTEGGKKYNTMLTGIGLETAAALLHEDLTTDGTFNAALGTTNKYGFSIGDKVVAPMIYANSYTYDANVFISKYGTMGLAKSTKVDKLDIVDVPDMLQKGYNLLTINPRQWFDKTSVEAYADVQSGNSDSIESVVNIKPVTGMVAEEVASAGLDDYVVKDENNKVQGLAYDRLWTLLLPVLRDMNDKINKLQKKAGI